MNGLANDVSCEDLAFEVAVPTGVVPEERLRERDLACGLGCGLANLLDEEILQQPLVRGEHISDRSEQIATFDDRPLCPRRLSAPCCRQRCSDVLGRRAGDRGQGLAPGRVAYLERVARTAFPRTVYVL